MLMVVRGAGGAGAQEAIAQLRRLTGPGAREATPQRELDRARSRVIQEVVLSLGSVDACIRAVDMDGALGSPDASYVSSLVSGPSRIGDLMSRSVLGPFRTALALHELAERGQVVATTALRSPSQRPASRMAAHEVLVCDANPAQAAITRTLLRVALRPAPTLLTIDNASALREACRGSRARLILLDVELPGLDLTAFVRDQSMLDIPPSVIVLGLTVRIEVLRRSLSDAAVLIVRPLERQGLTAALQSLGLLAR